MNAKNIVTTSEIENAVIKVCKYIENNSNKNRMCWSNLSEEQLWCELVSCILGSKVLYETANSCVSHLYKLGLLHPQKIIIEQDNMEKRLENELSKPIFLHFKNKRCKYPYPKSRSKYIVKTAVEIYKNSDTTLKDILINCKNEYEAREIIREKSAGIGYKQASLFLRNISYSNNLAILDSHVIKYMRLMNMVTDTIFNLQNKKKYIKLEKILHNYAISRDMSISTLDIAIWVVMRLIQREFIIWQ